MPNLSPAKQSQRELVVRQFTDAVWAEAGIDKQRLLAGLNKAFTRIEEAMDAEKAIATRDGIAQVIDYPTRVRASEAMIETQGMRLGKQHEQGGSGQVTININAPWFEPGPTTGCGEAKIVEAEGEVS
jgi:hypothetical protein